VARPGAAESLARVEAEIAEEKARALARITAMLEGALGELERLSRRAEGLGEPERKALAGEHARQRERVKRFAWYLAVQREALGLRRHDAVRELLTIPPPLHR
jgi:hypothetical protein